MSKQNRWRRFSWSRCSRARFIVIIAAALLVCAGLIVYARAVREARGAYALANDLPRGALVYAQCADLPALVKRWDESTLKQQLVASTSFQQFENHHLAMKLAERWSEYNDALGFTLDAGALAGASQSKAALAIYDIGRRRLLHAHGRLRRSATSRWHNLLPARGRRGQRARTSSARVRLGARALR